MKKGNKFLSLVLGLAAAGATIPGLTACGTDNNTNNTKDEEKPTLNFDYKVENMNKTCAYLSEDLCNTENATFFSDPISAEELENAQKFKLLEIISHLDKKGTYFEFVCFAEYENLGQAFIRMDYRPTTESSEEIERESTEIKASNTNDLDNYNLVKNSKLFNIDFNNDEKAIELVNQKQAEFSSENITKIITGISSIKENNGAQSFTIIGERFNKNTQQTIRFEHTYSCSKEINAYENAFDKQPNKITESKYYDFTSNIEID